MLMWKIMGTPGSLPPSGGRGMLIIALVFFLFFVLVMLMANEVI